MGALFYRYCWHRVSPPLFCRYRHPLRSSSRPKAVYNPKAFIPHAASLDQGFPHCPISSTAASRRSMGRFSVPSLGNTLSRPLPVIALVGRYLTNKLIGRRPFLYRIAPLVRKVCTRGLHRELVPLSRDYARVQGKYLRVTNSFAADTSVLRLQYPLDLHALSTPPAFILS